MTQLTQNTAANIPSPVQCSIDVGVNGWEPDALLAWVGGCPGSARLHVTLPANRSGRYGNRVQRTLLSMGCTVTRRVR